MRKVEFRFLASIKAIDLIDFITNVHGTYGEECIDRISDQSLFLDLDLGVVSLCSLVEDISAWLPSDNAIVLYAIMDPSCVSPQ